MNYSNIENENILERQHSCKWYFDEATTAYDELRGEKENSSRKLPALNDYLPILKGIFTDNSFTKVRKSDATSKYKEMLCKDKNAISIFPLFVRDPEKINEQDKDEILKDKDLFERKKFKICRALDAIDSIVTRLCSDNVDSSMLLTGKIVDAETVLKWLYTAANQGEVSVQENDRADVIFRQIVNWYLLQKEDDKETPDEKVRQSTKRLLRVFTNNNNTISTAKSEGSDWTDEEERKENIDIIKDSGWTDECKKSLMPTIKQCMLLTIGDIYDTYEKLNGFRRYAIHFEMAKDGMRDKKELNKLLSLAYAILNFLLSVCASYMRINELQLPRAEFKGARLVHSNISRSNFSNADFRYVDMSFGIAKDCDFSSATLEEVLANNADFTGSLFSYADVSGADFTGATLNKVKMDSVNMGQCSLKQLHAIIHDNDFLSQETAQSIDWSNIVNSNYYKKYDPKDFYSWMQEKKQQSVAAGKSVDKENFENISNKASSRVSKVDLDKVSEITKTQQTYENLLNEDSMEFWWNSYSEYAKAQKNECEKLSVDKDIYKIIQSILKEDFKPDDLTELQKKAMRKLTKLESASVKQSMLSDLNLNLINMNQASFNDSDLSGCLMAYTDAENTDFSQTNLAGTTAFKANFHGATFAKALPFNAWFIDCRMAGANFSEANMTNTQIINTCTQNFINKYVSSIPYKKTIEENGKPFMVPEIDEEKKPHNNQKNEKETIIPDENIINCDSTFRNTIANKIILAGCDFSRSTFQRSLFRNAILFDDNMSSTVWDDTDLTYALLKGVIFNRSSMKRCSLQEAQIFAADFSCCNLSESKMLGCNVDKVNFYDSNMSKLNLAHAKVSNTVFRETLVDGLNVSGTYFENCVFIGIDFCGCIGLSKANFKDCIFIDCSDGSETLAPDYDNNAGYLRIGKRNLHSNDGKGILSRYHSENVDVDD